MTPPSPATPPPPGAPKNKTLLVLGGALAGILVVGTLIGILSSSGGPSSTLDSFLEAVSRSDKETALSLVCAKHSSSSGLGLAPADGELSWDISDEQVMGDTAQVTLSLTLSRKGTTITRAALAELRKENGEWKVCDIDEKD